MPIWGRCPHFETAILLIYSQYLYPAKVASPQKGQNEGMMPVWTMTKVILSFSHCYGVVKTHHPGVHGFSVPKFVDFPLAWLLEKEYDLFRMILNVLNSLKLFCRRRLDIVWRDLVEIFFSPIRGKIQEIQWLWWLLAFRLGGYHKRQNHKSRNTFLFQWISLLWKLWLSRLWVYILDLTALLGTQVEQHSFETHKREILKLKTLDAE